MLRKVKLYGQLAKFVGHRVLEADVHSAAEAIRFLLANWPELEEHMADQYYKVSAGNWDIGEKELHYPTGSSDIKIVPVVGGAGGNVTNILIGAALIGGALLFAPYTFSFLGVQGAGWGGAAGAAGGAIGAGAASAMVGIGSYLILGSIANMLTPVPEVPETTQDPQNSFSFSGTQNTSRAGVPIPICYGEIITGSIVISAAVDTVQVET